MCGFLRSFFLLLLLAGFLQVSGQNTERILSSSPEEAKKFFEYGDYANAIRHYDFLLSEDSLSADYHYYLGISYLRSVHHEKALEHLIYAKRAGFHLGGKPKLYYDNAYDTYESESPDFNLARAYHLHRDFEEALKHYQLFHGQIKSAYKRHAHDKDLLIIEKFIQECENGKVLSKKSQKVRIENLGELINTEYEEIVPLVNAEETVLIFTTRRPETTGNTRDEHERYMEDVYISYKANNGKWSKPVGISEKINTPEHDACVGLSQDGQVLILYRNNHHGTGDLYLSSLDGNSWSEPVKLPDGINTKYLENSASVSADGKRLFFTSNRPGGHGKSDIYTATRDEKGAWSNVRNLGDKVNTPYDDDAPFIHADGKTLYFSSKGHNTMGGYDVFRTVYNERNKTWSEAENLGNPINTPENDVFFVFSANGERAYYSSHRDEDNFGGEDLYVLNFKQEIDLIHVHGVVKDNKGKAVQAKIMVSDNESGADVGVFRSNSESGKFTILLPPGKNYGIHVESQGYITHSENIYLPDNSDYFERKIDFELYALNKAVGKPLVLVLRNVFFEPEQAKLSTQSHNELDKYVNILQEEQNLMIEIAGHTDADGRADYNMTLSQKRAQSVAKYLVKKGIDEKRLFATGYGEQVPVASNETISGKQQNRRTELIIHDVRHEGELWKKGRKHYQLRSN